MIKIWSNAVSISFRWTLPVTLRRRLGLTQPDMVVWLGVYWTLGEYFSKSNHHIDSRWAFHGIRSR